MAEGSTESLPEISRDMILAELLIQDFDIPMMDINRLILNKAVKYTEIGKFTAIFFFFFLVNQKQ